MEAVEIGRALAVEIRWVVLRFTNATIVTHAGKGEIARMLPKQRAGMLHSNKQHSCDILTSVGTKTMHVTPE